MILPEFDLDQIIVDEIRADGAGAGPKRDGAGAGPKRINK